MSRRTPLIAAATGALLAVSAALAVGPAAAEQQTLSVTLANGATVQVTVDVPPGTPASAVKIPGITERIIAVRRIGGPNPAAPTPTATPAPSAAPAPSVAPGAPATPGATATPAPGAAGEDPGGDDEGEPGAATRADRVRARRRARARRNGEANADRRPDRRAAPDPVEPEAAIEVAPSESADPAQLDPGAALRRNGDGTPTAGNPGISLATPGAAAIGVPNFFIDKFRIPPFLLPIYQAAGTQYGIRWEVLAAINEIETDYGRNLNVSSAGAQGWMQFMPATWRTYGVDGNEDGVRDPYNPVDAIFAAARYLKAAGAERDLAKAVFAYNHADWYVDSVLMRARVIGGLPADFVGSLTGLTQGRFPVYAKATYADDLGDRALSERRRRRSESAALAVPADAGRRGINVYARRGAPVIAVNDGQVVKVGTSRRLGRFVALRDAFGNTFTYARLASVADTYPAAKPATASRQAVADELELPDADPAPTRAASAGQQVAPARKRAPAGEGEGERPASSSDATRGKVRLFANPRRPQSTRAGGAQQVFEAGGEAPGITTRSSLATIYGLKRSQVELRELKVGSRVAAGTVLGRIGASASSRSAPHALFEIRPAGRGAPRIDPKPILDGWKLLESTAAYRAEGRNALFGDGAAGPSIGQVLLMDKETLARRILDNPRIEVYACGRRDIATGQVDRRVLASLEFLAASGLRPTVTSLRCGHGERTAAGGVSAHASGNGVDIAKVNGVPIIGHQGPGSVTEVTIQRLLTLQGPMKPDQIISLMKFAGADNTLAMDDHADHIHVGWRPPPTADPATARRLGAVLKPKQWDTLVERLDQIENPTVRAKPSRAARRVPRRERGAAPGADG